MKLDNLVNALSIYVLGIEKTSSSKKPSLGIENECNLIPSLFLL